MWGKLNDSHADQGRIQEFKLGGAFKNIAPSRGRRGNDPPPFCIFFYRHGMCFRVLSVFVLSILF
jgi:hypothetical protein